MSVLKKILLTLAFVLATLVVPAVILLLFVDALNYFVVYVVAFGLILFAILGFIVISLIDIQSNLKKTVEELKMQNAAIAYKLTNSNSETVIVPDAPVTSFNPVSPVVPVSDKTEATQPVSDTSKVNLNPADPLVMPVAKKKTPAEEPVIEKKTDDGFDDFQ